MKYNLHRVKIGNKNGWVAEHKLTGFVASGLTLMKAINNVEHMVSCANRG